MVSLVPPRSLMNCYIFLCRLDYIITLSLGAMRFEPLGSTPFRDSRCTFYHIKSFDTWHHVFLLRMSPSICTVTSGNWRRINLRSYPSDIITHTSFTKSFVKFVFELASPLALSPEDIACWWFSLQDIHSRLSLKLLSLSPSLWFTWAEPLGFGI